MKKYNLEKTLKKLCKKNTITFEGLIINDKIGSFLDDLNKELKPSKRYTDVELSQAISKYFIKATILIKK